MKIKKTYITDDGEEFTDIKAAKIHQANIEIDKYVTELLPAHDVQGSRDRERLIKFIKNNRESLRELLSKIRNSMRGVKEE